MNPEETAVFLKECEEKFTNRFTEKDIDYAQACKRLSTVFVPPVMPRRLKNDRRSRRN